MIEVLWLRIPGLPAHQEGVEVVFILSQGTEDGTVRLIEGAVLGCLDYDGEHPAQSRHDLARVGFHSRFSQVMSPSTLMLQDVILNLSLRSRKSSLEEGLDPLKVANPRWAIVRVGDFPQEGHARENLVHCV